MQAVIVRAFNFHPKATHGSGLVGEIWVGEDNSVVVYLFVRIHLSQDFPGGPVAGTPSSQCREPRVWSLLRELRAHMLQLKILHAATKKKERKKKIPTATIKTLHSHLNKYFFFKKKTTIISTQSHLLQFTLGWFPTPPAPILFLTFSKTYRRVLNWMAIISFPTLNPPKRVTGGGRTCEPRWNIYTSDHFILVSAES